MTQAPEDLDADTEETPVVSKKTATESVEMKTEVDLPSPLLDGTTPVDAVTPAVTPRAGSAQVSSPVLALAKPSRRNTVNLERKLRLPTPSEIQAAIESTPTEPVPLAKPAAEQDEEEEEEEA